MSAPRSFGVRVGVLALRHRDAVALGQQLERLKEADALDFHDELEDVAAHAAAEALVELVARVDGERRRLFGVERAQARCSAASRRRVFRRTYSPMVLTMSTDDLTCSTKSMCVATAAAGGKCCVF